MRLDPSDDLRAFQDAADRVLAPHRAFQPRPGGRWAHAAALERELAAGGYFDALNTEGLGRVAAVHLVLDAMAVPDAAEVMASALLVPWLCPGLPGPTALLLGDRSAPARFLPVARSVIAVRFDGVEVLELAPGDVDTVDSLFAYPMGVLRQPFSRPWRAVPAERARVHAQVQIGLAAEITGSLKAGLDAVLEHVRHRRQFGRALGSFQAVQHRLAQAAVKVEGARWLTLRAAAAQGHDEPLHAALALGQAQAAALTVSTDLHQVMGAMGLTLEHPLHRWTYRVRLLLSALGGSECQFQAAARAAWPAAAATAAMGAVR